MQRATKSTDFKEDDLFVLDKFPYTVYKVIGHNHSANTIYGQLLGKPNDVSTAIDMTNVEITLLFTRETVKNASADQLERLIADKIAELKSRNSSPPQPTIVIGDIVAINYLKTRTACEVVSTDERGVRLRHFHGPQPSYSVNANQLLDDITLLIQQKDRHLYGDIDMKRCLDVIQFPFERQPAPEVLIKPPLGLRPRRIAEFDRGVEIIEAMRRYVAEQKRIPREWILELADRIGEVEAPDTSWIRP